MFVVLKKELYFNLKLIKNGNIQGNSHDIKVKNQQ